MSHSLHLVKNPKSHAFRSPLQKCSHSHHHVASKPTPPSLRSHNLGLSPPAPASLLPSLASNSSRGVTTTCVAKRCLHLPCLVEIRDSSPTTRNRKAHKFPLPRPQNLIHHSHHHQETLKTMFFSPSTPNFDWNHHRVARPCRLTRSRTNW